ncbi:toll/interleukin-1 receptor domain-containing adapter protein isoform X5 [Cervus elaphus]|uniref:toll/interleukin-1 receptor domain-containing adapter protein isoform X5 n=1 Tax=Cervus elaphus TaxID=9860 RepID=UPI001CC324E6|nr:toll/interleukin-1 receptor domain-containing adapter protein isoform X5 [Cervus elaphus]
MKPLWLRWTRHRLPISLGLALVPAGQRLTSALGLERELQGSWPGLAAPGACLPLRCYHRTDCAWTLEKSGIISLTCLKRKKENSPEAASSAAGFGESEGKSSPSFRRLSGCADAREPPRGPEDAAAEDVARLPARERRAEEGPRGLAPPRFRGSGRPKALPPDGRAAPRRSPRSAPVASRRRPAHPGAAFTQEVPTTRCLPVALPQILNAPLARWRRGQSLCWSC